MPFHHPAALTLANTGGSMSVAVPVLIWVGVLIAAVLIAGALLLLLRRRLLNQDRQDSSGMGLFEHLQSLRDSGEMSQEEYDAARRALVARASGTTPPDQGKPQNSTSPRGPGAEPGDPAEASVLSAQPGYDLTGEPLPASPDAPDAPDAPGPRTTLGRADADDDAHSPDQGSDEGPDDSHDEGTDEGDGRFPRTDPPG